MKFDDICPFVRQALVVSLDKDNRHDVNKKLKTVDCRLFNIIEGGGKMIIEGTEYPLMPGTTVIFRAGTEYVWEIEKAKFYSVNFDYTHDFSHIKKTYHPKNSINFTEGDIIECPVFEDVPQLNSPIVLHDAPLFSQLISQITAEYYMGGKYCDMLLSSLMRSAIVYGISTDTRSSPRERSAASLAKSIVSYLNTNYEYQITNEDLSAIFNFHPVYLGRIFKAYTGESIHDFLINRRIGAAMEMLRSDTVPISEAALKCGFGSLFHFSKTFKKRVGMTPSEFRSINEICR